MRICVLWCQLDLHRPFASVITCHRRQRGERVRAPGSAILAAVLMHEDIVEVDCPAPICIELVKECLCCGHSRVPDHANKRHDSPTAGRAPHVPWASTRQSLHSCAPFLLRGRARILSVSSRCTWPSSRSARAVKPPPSPVGLLPSKEEGGKG